MCDLYFFCARISNVNASEPQHNRIFTFSTVVVWNGCRMQYMQIIKKINKWKPKCVCSCGFVFCGIIVTQNIGRRTLVWQKIKYLKKKNVLSTTIASLCLTLPQPCDINEYKLNLFAMELFHRSCVSPRHILTKWKINWNLNNVDIHFTGWKSQ